MKMSNSLVNIQIGKKVVVEGSVAAEVVFDWGGGRIGPYNNKTKKVWNF